MTRDEIEEVKRFWADEGGDHSSAGLRLLEERERLLEALRALLGSDTLDRDEEDYTVCRDAASAIAFAEAPSSKEGT